MRVTIVTTSYPLSSTSVSGIFLKNLVDRLDELLDCYVVCPADKNECDITKVAQVRYAPSKFRFLFHSSGGLPSAISRHKVLGPLLLVSFIMGTFFSCMRAARTTDVYFANWALMGVVTGMVAKLLGKPLVTTIRGSDTSGGRLNNSILKLCFKCSDAIVFVSQGLKLRYDKEYPEYCNKFHFIPNGVSTFDGIPEKKKEMQIITVGSLIPRKDIKVQLEAAKLLLEEGLGFKWLIVGGGEQLESIRSFISRNSMEDHVELLGELPHHEVLRLYSESQIFVLSSLLEGRPNVVVEAMAAGLCVISTDILAVKDVITDGDNGLLFPCGDAVMLKKLVYRVALDQERRELIADKAEKWVVEENLTWRSAAEKYNLLFRAVGAD
ncbi:glycosyltransferase [Hahella aquimaris]|uniref:glycosyltransferase n=1 Tax=Hahella sp. HNIBRBA332 TaxID=3015983 RepID=UPI00273BA3FB|nr:glycosyltransferase [Hahella sp. HNIBRBA332]WLQ14631.1 glycosyltransferase [Hahella sp. HNIBRBA332]